MIGSSFLLLHSPTLFKAVWTFSSHRTYLLQCTNSGWFTTACTKHLQYLSAYSASERCDMKAIKLSQVSLGHFPMDSKSLLKCLTAYSWFFESPCPDFLVSFLASWLIAVCNSACDKEILLLQLFLWFNPFPVSLVSCDNADCCHILSLDQVRGHSGNITLVDFFCKWWPVQLKYHCC